MAQNNLSSSLTEIALRCGFSSSATFARAFRRRFGLSASEWRRQSSPGIQKSRNRKSGGKKSKAPAASLLHLESVRSEHSRHAQGTLAMDVAIKDLPGKHIAYVANLGGYRKDRIRQAWDRLCGWAAPLDLLSPPTEFLGISWDNPEITPPDRCRYYACITIPPKITPPLDIGVMDIPGGRYAVLGFEGSEKDLQQAYHDFYGVWLAGSGFEPADSPCYEIYYANPDDDPEGKFVMDICMPVQPL
jgi:AraC family transcriptional regulator